MPLVLVIFATLCCLVVNVAGNTETLFPRNVSDASGNFADSSSQITWSGVPAQVPYVLNADNVDYEAGALKSFYKMMNLFLDVVFVQDIPYGKFLRLVILLRFPHFRAGFV